MPRNPSRTPSRRTARPAAARHDDVPLPRLPKTVDTLLGPVPVTMVPRLARPDPETGKSENLCGRFNWETREIEIERGMHRASQWYTLFHEEAHAVLADSGVAQVLDHERTEAICDAFGCFHVGALRARIRRRRVGRQAGRE